MASNRKQPFGYRMEKGEIVPHEKEAEAVRWIYGAYLAGAAYSALVASLKKWDVPYDTGKLWNKNMVARILEDMRYIGVGDYPQILTQEQFDAVQTRRQERTVPSQKTPAQKELRRLCGESPPAWVDRQVLGILNQLIQTPEMISVTAEEHEVLETALLRRKIDDALRSPPVDEAQIRSEAMHLAALRLDAIGPEEYETRHLRGLFCKLHPMEKLDKELLHESVCRVSYSDGTVSVLLKNQQLLKGEPTP